MKGTKLLVISSIFVLCVAVAGCQQQQAQVEPRDAWGIVRIPPGQTIKIRVAVSQSDNHTGIVGVEQRRGAELAARQFDTIQGFLVDLEISDPACSSDGGADAAHDAVGSAQTVGVVGMTCSSSCISSASILDGAHVIEVSPSCEASLLTDPVSQREIFITTSFGATQEGVTSGDFAFSEMGAHKIGIVSYNNAETADIVTAFRSRVEELGATVVATANVVPGQYSYDTALKEIAAKDLDLIYAPLLPVDATTFVAQFKKSVLKDLPLLGGRYYLSQWFIDKVQGDSEGVYAVGPNIDNAQTTSVYATYTNIYRKPPTSSEVAFSYDAMRLLLEAIKKVAVVGSDNNLLIGRQALKNALIQTADYRGLTGSITCTAWGDCSASGSLVVARVKSGKWKNVFIP